MKGKKATFIILLLFLVLLIAAVLLYDRLSGKVDADSLAQYNEYGSQAQMQQESGETAKTEAPDFTVTDSQGNEVKLSDFKGKPVVLNFWASWCGPCKSEMPEFDQAYARYGDEINFLMVNLTDGSRETLEKAAEFIQENGYTFPVYYDTTMEAAMVYGVSSIPVTYFIDADGNMVAQGMGALNEETLQSVIDTLLE